jgi:hypothetical protein
MKCRSMMRRIIRGGARIVPFHRKRGEKGVMYKTLILKARKYISKEQTTSGNLKTYSNSEASASSISIVVWRHTSLQRLASARHSNCFTYLPCRSWCGAHSRLSRRNYRHVHEGVPEHRIVHVTNCQASLLGAMMIMIRLVKWHDTLRSSRPHLRKHLGPRRVYHYH